MSEGWALYLGDALAILGTLMMSFALSGLLRFPNHFIQLHSASMTMVAGTFVVLASALGTGELDLVLRAALVAGLLLLTYPVGTHALAAREWREERGEPEREP